jgi:hypothetical protein
MAFSGLSPNLLPTLPFSICVVDLEKEEEISGSFWNTIFFLHKMYVDMGKNGRNVWLQCQLLSNDCMFLDYSTEKDPEKCNRLSLTIRVPCRSAHEGCQPEHMGYAV